MSWQDYFECNDAIVDGKTVKYYRYKDSDIIRLPTNLPMPPTNVLNGVFYNCKQLQDITALANWDVSNVKYMQSMFSDCHELRDITALANWKATSVGAVHYMFYNCPKLQYIVPS
jgi:surface protein